MWMGRGRQVAAIGEAAEQNQIGIEVGQFENGVDADILELCGLSGDKPVFHVAMKKSNVHHPYYMSIPWPARDQLTAGHEELPAITQHGSRRWQLTWKGNVREPRFLYSGWKRFATENRLQMGDLCIFEVWTCTSDRLDMKAFILRNLPLTGEKPGTCAETAMDVTGDGTSEDEETMESAGQSHRSGAFMDVICRCGFTEGDGLMPYICDCSSEDEAMVAPPERRGRDTASPGRTRETAVDVTGDDPAPN